MILQALHEYYDRKRDADEGALPAPGFERKEIPFIIVLDEEGKFLELESTRDGEGRSARARVYTVPQGEKRPGTKGWQKAFLLWDHAGYVLGHPGEGGDPEKAEKQHSVFVDRVERTFGSEPEDSGVRAALCFLKAGDFEPVFSHPLWEKVVEANGNLSFRLRGERRLICSRPAVRAAVEAELADGNAAASQCLITGKEEPIAVLHPAIKGVRGAQTMGANIVSFNLDAFSSFGKSQGANAPVGEPAVFAYTTALNHLLDKESRQKAQVGDATAVFWAAKDNPLENLAADLLAGEFEARDDPDAGVDELRAMYHSPWGGNRPLKEDDTRFYALGLSPNASRISIRFWEVSTVSELAKKILEHFTDLEIVHPSWSRKYPPLMELLRATAVQRKLDNIPPNLAGEIMRAILTGGGYPRTLLSAAVRRNRLEQKVTPERAALVKAWLVREARLNNPSTLEVGVSLDESNLNVGYRLGRLFAVLERTQEAANPNLNRTIRESYYGTASSIPVAVFPRLMKLKNHHIAKLDNRGQVINLEKLIGTIMDGIDDFPPVLPVADQGRFSIGYYHQRQDFFTKPQSDGGEDE